MKQENVFIDAEGTPKIGDFGLVDSNESSEVDKSTFQGLARHVAAQLNTTTVHYGTARYMALELLIPELKAPRTPSTDVYAMGCMGLDVSVIPLSREPAPLGDV